MISELVTQSSGFIYEIHECHNPGCGHVIPVQHCFKFPLNGHVVLLTIDGWKHHVVIDNGYGKFDMSRAAAIEHIKWMTGGE